MGLAKYFIVQLLEYGNKIERCENKGILCLGDVTSLLPGHDVTRTALYKIAEAVTFQRASGLVISLKWMDDWKRQGGKCELSKRLDEYFTLGALSVVNTTDPADHQEIRGTGVW